MRFQSALSVDRRCAQQGVAWFCGCLNLRRRSEEGCGSGFPSARASGRPVGNSLEGALALETSGKGISGWAPLSQQSFTQGRARGQTWWGSHAPWALQEGFPRY
jgi:hypothetical protein